MSYTSGFVFGDLDNSQSQCLKASLPVVYQVFKNPVPIGDGATPVSLLTVPTGDLMGYGGQVDNRGNCFNLLVSVTYWGGADCNKCSILNLTSVVETFTVKAGDVFNIPAGYWSLIQWSIVDDSGTATTAVVDGTFSFYSSHTPACSGCTPTVGQLTEPVARVSAPVKLVEGEVKKV